jgi:TatD related DNase
MQRKYFEWQLDLVTKFQLPLFLHCYNAFDYLYEIIQRFWSCTKAKRELACYLLSFYYILIPVSKLNIKTMIFFSFNLYISAFYRLKKHKQTIIFDENLIRWKPFSFIFYSKSSEFKNPIRIFPSNNSFHEITVKILLLNEETMKTFNW